MVMMSGKARERAVAAFADATMTEIRADMEIRRRLDYMEQRAAAERGV